MTTVRDRLWIWGQNADIHYIPDETKSMGNLWNLPGHSRMTAVEGAFYMDIPNICRVRMRGLPEPPFDQESMVMDRMDRVVWSLLGDSACEATEWGDLDEVVRQARMFPNIIGGVFDDFISPERMKQYTPEKLHTIRERLNNETGRPMEMWTVYYENNMAHTHPEEIEKRLEQFDVITFWTWSGQNLKDSGKHIEAIKDRYPDKKLMAGCYMWDYGNSAPLPQELMEEQCGLYLEKLHEGVIDGIIFCSNCIADLGIPQVEWTRKWIRQHRDEKVR